MIGLAANRPTAAADLSRPSGDPKRRRLSIAYGAGSVALAVVAAVPGGIWWWLLWPALSLALVAVFYGRVGAAGFAKRPDGRHAALRHWLLAPYLAAARLNAWAWTWRRRRPVQVADGVWIGPLPAAREATAEGFLAVVDLAAELERGFDVPRYRSVAMLDLVAPPPEALLRAARAIEACRRLGPVLVACALGYGRSAAAVATWLVASGRAADVAAAEAALRVLGRPVALDAACRRAIAAAAREGLA